MTPSCAVVQRKPPQSAQVLGNKSHNGVNLPDKRTCEKILRWAHSYDPSCGIEFSTEVARRLSGRVTEAQVDLVLTVALDAAEAVVAFERMNRQYAGSESLAIERGRWRERAVA